MEQFIQAITSPLFVYERILEFFSKLSNKQKQDILKLVSVSKEEFDSSSDVEKAKVFRNKAFYIKESISK